MKVLITGVHGFVGRQAAAAFSTSGHEVWGTTRTPLPGAHSELLPADRLATFDLSRGVDGQDLGRWSEVRFDACLHLAAEAHPATAARHPSAAMDANGAGTRRLLNWFSVHHPGARFLYVSSSAVYGDVNHQRPISEQDSTLTQSPYGLSKLAGESFAREAAQGGADVMITRPFHHTGPGQLPVYFVPKVARQTAAIHHHLAPPVLHLGRLDLVRDYLDVRDTVSAYEHILRLGKTGEVYNVGAGRGVRLEDLVNILNRLLRDRVVTITDPSLVRPGEPDHFVADISRLHEQTGWSPRHRLESTLDAVRIEQESQILACQAL